jgi:hypothetical protein
MHTATFRSFLLIAGLAVMGITPPARARHCGPPPKAKPQRWTAAESFPPLPLPVTPLRRSEKKRPPAAPLLIGKVRYGKSVWKVDDNGNKVRNFDPESWTTPASDAKNLLKFAHAALDVRYRADMTTFESFSWDPAQTPILYLTGEEAFALSDGVRERLRQYVQDGGLLLCNAGAGKDAYIEAWTREIEQKIFRKERRRVRLLPPEHPVYTAVYGIDQVRYWEHKDGRMQARTGRPELYGVNIGSRTAVIFSPYNLACGWDGHTHDYGRHVWPREDAMKLGTNILAYALATYPLGRFQAHRKVYHEARAEQTATRFTFGQVIHGGDWDPTPDGPLGLMEHLDKHSTLPVRFAREAVDLGTPEAFNHAFLYLTGLHDFRLTDAELGNLRRYLMNGGILFAESCCGRQEFDKAFRREIARVLEGAELQPIPTSHPVYIAAPGGPLDEVSYTERLTQLQPDLQAPRLEGIRIGGTLAVIYSRDDLSSGWQQTGCPYRLGYAREDALRIGHSVLIYALTH